jgi:uroporphyrin-III C-methyltransferase
MSASKQGMESNGYVYLIGAGPGDPELLTLKADRVLREADVILYDDLVSSDILARYNVEKIFTGKRKDNHHFEQDAINDELVRQAKEGKRVARLKGGDPFIFGRGGEELETLRHHGIRYEIVPGITAAHGAASYAEIPLTMRKLSSSVAFCTGHPVTKIQVPSADTLVYYMVASSAHAVLEAVAASGRPDSTPVALVHNATRYNQKALFGTLGEWLRGERAVYSPALLIIGESISLAVADNWFQAKQKVLLVGDDTALMLSGDAFFVSFTKAAQRETLVAEPLELHLFDALHFASVADVEAFVEHYPSLPSTLRVTCATAQVMAVYQQHYCG